MATGDDLKKTFGAFMRTALHQLDTVKDVVVKKSKEGKQQLDVAMLKRKRREALADLGEVVAKLAADGKIGEEEFPDLSAPLSALEAIDERIATVGKSQPEEEGEEESEDSLDSERGSG